MPSKRSRAVEEEEAPATKIQATIHTDEIDAEVKACNEAFGAETETTWSSSELVPFKPEDTAVTTIPTHEGDISAEIAKAIRSSSCYYASLKDYVAKTGDLKVAVYIKDDANDPSKSYTSINIKNRPSQIFNGSSPWGLAILMPISVRFNYLGMPLGTVNSTNSNIKKGEGGGKMKDTQVSGGNGSLLGLASDCEGGVNVRMVDACYFLYEYIERACHHYMQTTQDERLRSLCAAGWKHYCNGETPNVYWFQRLFYKIDPKKDLDAGAKIKDISDAYNKKDHNVMMRIRPHKLFARDLELRQYEFREPEVYRLPMKPEAEQQLWKVLEDGTIADLQLIPMPINQQAASVDGDSLTMELITPDTIESGAKTGKNIDARLHNRYKCLKEIWIGSVSTMMEFRGTKLAELLEFLKTIDPPTPLTDEQRFNLDSRTKIVSANEALMKQMLEDVVL